MGNIASLFQNKNKYKMPKAKPNTDKTSKYYKVGNIEVGTCSMQGWRAGMEDDCTVMENVGETWAGVFDGHGGAWVANFTAKHLFNNIRETESFRDNFKEMTKELEKGTIDDKVIEKVKQDITTGFLLTEEQLRDAIQLNPVLEDAGTTAVVALITEKVIIFGNLGDSRAILCCGGRSVMVTRDHKPSDKTETDRIKDAGGFVTEGRVNGVLATSRSLGDFDLKTAVSPYPELQHVMQDGSRDMFLVLATDGVWDVMDNDDVCQFVEQMLYFKEEEVEKVAGKVLDNCLERGSEDNMAVVIVKLPMEF